MKGPFTTSIFDDGKGRQLPSQAWLENVVNLTFKEDPLEVKDKGDYSITKIPMPPYSNIEVVAMVCPFCNREAPLPMLISMNSKNPLDIEDELFCKFCSSHFYITNGVAVRSWLAGGTPSAFRNLQNQK